MLPTEVLVFLHPLVELPLGVWELGNLSHLQLSGAEPTVILGLRPLL